MELTKPRITFLVLITTLVGFYMGSRGGLNFLLLFHAIVGTGLVATLAGAIGRMAWPIEAIFYVIAGVAWIAPLKPLLRWMETGKWRG